MAKKKPATKSKKTVARSKAPSKKKSTTKAAPSKPAAAKPATRRKASAKKASPKMKPATKKPATAKIAPKKAPTKKAATSKAVAVKPKAKQAAAKPAKAASSAKTAPVKKAPAMGAAAKKATIKKAPRKSASKSESKEAKAPAQPKVKKKPAPKAKDERYTLSEARAAASGLAARAGLKLVRAHGNTEPEEKAKTRQLKKSPLTKAQLEKYREILLQKRAEVASDVTAMQSEAFGPSDGGAFPQHPGDQGSDEYEQSLSLGLAESQRKLLMEIREALVRIDDGTYGICALTGGPIGRNRLDATPWTKLSLEGAREQDRQNYYQ